MSQDRRERTRERAMGLVRRVSSRFGYQRRPYLTFPSRDEQGDQTARAAAVRLGRRASTESKRPTVEVMEMGTIPGQKSTGKESRRVFLFQRLSKTLNGIKNESLNDFYFLCLNDFYYILDLCRWRETGGDAIWSGSSASTTATSNANNHHSNSRDQRW